jgi:cell wall-associated protease
MKKLFSILTLCCLAQTLMAGERLIVKASKRPVSLLKLAQVKSIEKFTTIEDEYFNQLYSIELHEQVKVDTTLMQELLKSPEVEKVETVNPVETYSVYPNAETQVQLGENLTRYQWGLFNQAQKIRREIDENHSEVLTGIRGQDIDFVASDLKNEVVVAVLDTGIDFNHPELKDKIALNSIECNQSGTRVDRDLNKYPADCQGWNFTVPLNSPDSNNVMDEDGHGTHVAGIMAASLNQKGMAGLSDAIKILPVKVLSSRLSSQAATDRLALGVLYAIERGADVINFSMGWSKSMDTEYLQNAIQLAIRKNIAIIAAAGNNSSNDAIFPCAYPNVICVGAMSANGSIANFSNYGGMVDVLAPGELILSTIPTAILPSFFSMKGFDFKSGTSQASPFVAGIAALIKQKFPSIAFNELAARIYESTKTSPQDNLRGKHVQHGLISMNKALNQNEVVSIKPTFKMMEQVLFRARDLKFAFKLPIKNYWKPAQNITISIKVNNSDIQLNQNEFSIDQMGTNQVRTIDVSGQLKHLMMDNRFDFTVSIKSDDGEHGTYRHDTVIARFVEGDQELIVKPVRFNNNQTKPLALIQKGVMIPLIKPVSDRHLIAGSNYYYLLKQEDKNIRVHLFELLQNEFKEVSQDLVLPNAKKILNVMFGYFNSDNTPDILIRAIAEDSNGEFVQYSYFNLNGSELFSGDTHWKFNPDVVLEDFQNMVLVAQPHKKYGMIKVPFFTANSKLTENDQATGFWSRRDDSVRKHIYYLQPQYENNKTRLITRTLTTKKVRDELRQALKMTRTQEVKIDDFNLQSQEQMLKGEAILNISSGTGFNKKAWIISLKPQLALKEIVALNKAGHQLDQLMQNPTYLLEDENIFKNQYSNMTLVGFPSKSSARITTINEQAQFESIDFKYSDPTDHLLGFLSSFKNNQTQYFFFQSRSSIVMFEKNQKQETFEQKRAAVRFSFLPGFMFNQLYTPVMLNTADGNRPGLLVDGSEISAQHMEVITIDENNKLIAPIKFSIRPPANCKSLGRNTSQDKLEISLLCVDKTSGFSILSLPL